MEPDKRQLLYLQWAAHRRNGRTDEQIAGALDFASVPELRQTLAGYGFPVCRDCGEDFPGKGHACRESTEEPRRGQPVAGEIEDLPLAERAAPLFTEALGKLGKAVGWLHRRNEHLRGRRFVAEHRLSGDRGEAFRVYRRTDPTTWRSWCEEEGLDPDEDVHRVYVDEDDPLVVPKDSPAWPLPELVAAYILAGRNVADLVDTLHPRPGTVDRVKLDAEITGLRRAAERVAALVRGGKAGAGKRPPEITAAERRLGSHIRDLLERGYSEREIANRLQDGGFKPLPDTFEATVEEVQRIANLI